MCRSTYCIRSVCTRLFIKTHDNAVIVSLLSLSLILCWFLLFALDSKTTNSQTWVDTFFSSLSFCYLIVSFSFSLSLISSVWFVLEFHSQRQKKNFRMTMNLTWTGCSSIVIIWRNRPESLSLICRRSSPPSLHERMPSMWTETDALRCRESLDLLINALWSMDFANRRSNQIRIFLSLMDGRETMKAKGSRKKRRGELMDRIIGILSRTTFPFRFLFSMENFLEAKAPLLIDQQKKSR